MTTRDDNERTVEILTETYPKTFFSDPRKRRPLKPTIKHDIFKDVAANPNSELRHEDIEAAVEWYKSHIGYHMACSTAGASCIDLEGNVVSKITEVGANAARERVKEIREEMATRSYTNRTNSYNMPSPPPARIVTVPAPSPAADESMDLETLLASTNAHMKSATLLLQNTDLDPKLRPVVVRPVLELLLSEIKLLQSRHC